MVNFHQTVSNAAIQPCQQRRVGTRRQRRSYPRLKWVWQRQTRRGNERRLDRVILPIVIRPDERSITVA